MNNPWYVDDPSPSKNENLVYAHGTIMVISWMLLASTGILFARYGRHLRLSGRRKLLGDTIWFQLHRFILCMVTVATLLGFFLILIKEKGQWVSAAKDGGHIFAHSVLGAIIVCCALLQAWLALFRCNTDSSFRPIFNWLHRSMGYLAFFLSVPTNFLIVTESKVLPMQQDGLIAILSLWSAWIVIVVILFEIVEYRDRLNSKMGIYRVARNELMGQTTSLKRKMDNNDGANIRSLNEVKLFLFLLHIIVAVSLTIPLVVIIWLQN